MARQQGFELVWLWYLSAAVVWVQMGMNLLLLRSQFRKRLAFAPTTAASAVVGHAG
jgi:hypothetical protein